jgi:hypothetical protein
MKKWKAGSFFYGKTPYDKFTNHYGIIDVLAGGKVIKLFDYGPLSIYIYINKKDIKVESWEI